MKFGKKLIDTVRPQWADEYINYKRLKKILKGGVDQPPSRSDSPVCGGSRAGGGDASASTLLRVDDAVAVPADSSPLAAYASAEGMFLAQALAEVHKVRARALRRAAVSCRARSARRPISRAAPAARARARMFVGCDA